LGMTTWALFLPAFSVPLAKKRDYARSF
jgi:hypothetical protein